MNKSNKMALDRYFLRVWPDFKEARHRFNRSMVVSLASLLLSAIDLASIPLLGRSFMWYDVLAVAIFVGSLFYFIKSLSVRDQLIEQIAPERGRNYYSVSFPPKLGAATLQKDADIDHKRLFETEALRISNIYPNAVARKSHFERTFPGFGCIEMAHRSKTVDNWLLSDPQVQVEYAGSDFRLPSLTHEQRQLLYSKVSGPTLTRDEEKISLVSDIEVGIKSVRIEKCTYFDSLITNEAFRTTLFEKPEKAAYSGKIVSSFSEIKDLPYDDQGPSLYGLSSARAANHLGASVFALSDDGYPIFFEQGIDQEEGAGTLVVSGTGSANWDDRMPLREGANFLDIPKRTMMREFAEEAGLWKASDDVRAQLDRLRSTELVLDELAKKTTLIGYFRWVSRFGKPEFLGVTRTDVKLIHLKAQEEEVVDLRGGLGLRRQIFCISELEKYLRETKHKLESSNIGLGLSSAMLLFRLLEISTEGTAKMKERLAKSLGIRV